MFFERNKREIQKLMNAKQEAYLKITRNQPKHFTTHITIVEAEGLEILCLYEQK